MEKTSNTVGIRASSDLGQQENAVHGDVLPSLARLLARQAAGDLENKTPAPTTTPTSSNTYCEENHNAD